MAVRQIRGTALGVDGNPMINAAVTCDLSVPAAVTATAEVIASTLSTTTADGTGGSTAGQYIFNVWANADLSPSTSYDITVHSTQAHSAETLSIVVPSYAYDPARPTWFDIALDNLVVA